MDKYLEVQRRLVDLLRAEGVYFGYKDRLRLFWLRHNLPKGIDPTLEIVELLDELLELRTKGLEPKHVGEVYE